MRVLQLAALLIVACCAGPALITGGVLADAGRLLGSPVVIAAGLAIALGGVVIVLRRRARGRADCCDPSQETDNTDPVSRESDHGR